MSAALIAVSLGDTIERLGSYAGLSAVVGLGVLSLLYFAQAREVKRLREWAGREPERAVELEQRVPADAQRRVVAQPLAPATTAAQKAEAARTAAAAALYAQVPPPPPPPAPLVGPPGQLARPVVPTPPAPPAAGTVPATPGAGAVTTPASTPAPGSVPGATTPAAPAQGVGATAAAPPAATAAAAARQAATPSRTPSALGNGRGGQETHESDAARPDSPADLPADSPAPLSSDSAADGDGFSAARYGAIAAGAVAAVLVAVVLIVALTQGDDTTTQPNDFGSVAQPTATPAEPGSPSTNATAASPAIANRRATRVAVLNGTQQAGLARSVADQVQKAKYTVASVGNNADQQVPTTTVSYRAGNERAARIVAQAIGIDRGSAQPVDANTSAAADADIVVIVGTDQIE